MRKLILTLSTIFLVATSLGIARAGPGDDCSVFQPGPDWCSDCGPCDEGQGDCDGDGECASGLVCAQDVGANYGWPASRDVCEQPGGGGGSCSVYQPSADWCEDCGPCAEGEGDCEPGVGQCEPGLVCAQDVGANYGLQANWDVCEDPGGGCSLPVGHLDYCRDCGPCVEGQGDCEANSNECVPGLVCAQDVGANYGFDPIYDVCEQPGGGCPPFVASADACTTACPCDEGQGDCDGDATCEPGLVCVDDVGANYGWPASRDVCEQPGGGPYITSPARGSTLTGPSVTFYWTANGTSVDAWVLYVGTSVGASDIYISDWPHPNTYETANELPTDRSKVYVRLVYLTGGSWEYVDSEYIASDTCDANDHPDTMWLASDVRDVLTNYYCDPNDWRKCYWWVNASLCSIYDQDFFKFKPSNLSSITIRSAGNTDTVGGYTHIWNDGTWDFDGDDNSGDGLNFEIHLKYRVESDEWVYIHVAPTGYHTDHDYVLIVEVTRLD